jgi:hypothetical protein
MRPHTGLSASSGDVGGVKPPPAPVSDSGLHQGPDHGPGPREADPAGGPRDPAHRADLIRGAVITAPGTRQRRESAPIPNARASLARAWAAGVRL